MNEGVAQLAHELPDAELVIAFVSPLGTPLDAVEKELSVSLIDHGYQIASSVRISRLLDQLEGEHAPERPPARQERLMDLGTQLRRDHGGDILALMAVADINAGRDRDHDIAQPRRRAHLIRSLKHPDEIARLRNVYGQGFFLFGVSAPRRVRRQELIDKNFPQDEANRLLDKDAAEAESTGQQTRDAFQLADAYVRVDDNQTDMKAKIGRIVDLLLSCPFHPPTQEEHAMFLAYAAALRSADLSRQVGAVVANEFGDVVGSGANDAPAPGGGTYWPTSEGESADYLRGYDSNERERNKILARVLEALVPGINGVDALQPSERAALVAEYKDRLEGTGILDLTEFGRAVHAEMAALLACARAGVSPVGGTLYCTTFPCHNCAKHIIAAGIKRVVYVEPYPKSKAQDLHGDAISLPEEDAELAEDQRVSFEAFDGVGPRRFVDLFSLTLGSGRPLRRKEKDADGNALAWKRGPNSVPRLPLDPRSYLEREAAAATHFGQVELNHAKVIPDGEPTS